MQARLLVIGLLVGTAFAAEPKTEQPNTPKVKEWCIETKSTRPGKDGRKEVVTTKVCGPLPEPTKEAPNSPK